MTGEIYLADASALEQMPKLVRLEALPELWDSMSRAVEKKTLRFPGEVVKELNVTARFEQITSWASGQRSHIRQYNANIKYTRTLMVHAVSCGYDEGFISLDGSDKAAAGVGRLACQYTDEQTEFSIVTEDIGESPLAPTMAQLCEAANWNYISAAECLKGLGLGGFFR